MNRSADLALAVEPRAKTALGKVLKTVPRRPVTAATQSEIPGGP